MSDEKKVWTFGEASARVRLDTDLLEEDEDEEFVTRDEMAGYFNKYIDQLEAKIMLLNEDYFLAYDYVPLVTDEDEYDLPTNIYAKKLRHIMYRSGGLVYPVEKIKRFKKFEQIAMLEEFGEGAYYKYDIVNNAPGEEKMILYPPSRETAVLPPLGTTIPMKRWYIRNANRIPLTGEYTNPENILETSVNITDNEITVSPLVTYVTGDQVKVSVTGSNVLPSPLVAGTIYYVIAVSATVIKLATSAANAAAGTAIDLTTDGTGYFTIRVAATAVIMDATVIDIPEFTMLLNEQVKANCLFKDGDPRISLSLGEIDKLERLMDSSLRDAVPDGEQDLVEMDLSHYEEMS